MLRGLSSGFSEPSGDSGYVEVNATAESTTAKTTTTTTTTARENGRKKEINWQLPTERMVIYDCNCFKTCSLYIPVIHELSSTKYISSRTIVRH